MREFLGFKGVDPLLAQPFLQILARWMVLAGLLFVAPVQYWGYIQAGALIPFSALTLSLLVFIPVVWQIHWLPIRLRWLVLALSCFVVHLLLVLQRGGITDGWLAMCLGMVVTFAASGTVVAFCLLVLELVSVAMLRWILTGTGIENDLTPLLSSLGVLLQMLAVVFVLHRFLMATQHHAEERAGLLNRTTSHRQRSMAQAIGDIASAIDAMEPNQTAAEQPSDAAREKLATSLNNLRRAALGAKQ